MSGETIQDTRQEARNIALLFEQAILRHRTSETSAEIRKRLIAAAKELRQLALDPGSCERLSRLASEFDAHAAMGDDQ
ncbi:MAG: hypothetical protein KGJ78_01100 [Alphaproteobacteria bacterium]|nr:hypothetical protein [Alphaproteobacteria bacterium]